MPDNTGGPPGSPLSVMTIPYTLYPMVRTMPKPAPYRSKPIQVKVWFSEDDRALLEALALHKGISLSDVITLLVRQDARREGLLAPGKPARRS